MTAATYKIFLQIEEERKRQDGLWGEQNHEMPVYYTILAEEFGEVGQAIAESYLHQAPLGDIRTELIQTAAVCVAMVEALDRRNQHVPTVKKSSEDYY